MGEGDGGQVATERQRSVCTASWHRASLELVLFRRRMLAVWSRYCFSHVLKTVSHVVVTAL